MTDRAIQSDVQTEVTGQPTPSQRPKSSRELAMEAIYGSRLVQFETESGVKIERTEVKPEADPDADADDADADAERQRLAQLADEPSDEPVADEPPVVAKKPESPAPDVLKQKVKVKIDGQEAEATVEEMQREYQKGKTADKRLAEIARRERELAERETQLAAQRDTSATGNTPNPATPDAPVIDPSVAKQFTSALFDGDEEKAVAAFNAAVQSAVSKVTAGRDPTTQVDPEAIAAQVEQRFAVNSALKQSKTDYPELYADPDIEALAAMKIRAKREEGFSFADALEQTGKEFADKFGWKKTGHQAKANSTTRDDKMKRKEALDNVESANVKSSTTETPPLTNSQVIANMARARPGYGG